VARFVLRVDVGSICGKLEDSGLPQHDAVLFDLGLHGSMEYDRLTRPTALTWSS
jgi:hypothetical protein